MSRRKALVIGGDEIFRAITPQRATQCVRDAFVRHHNGEWQMPAKVYLTNEPHGDFRAMPASGDGIAILKWVTSFPDNRAKGLPVVVGVILVSDATTGEWLALVDGTAVTALRTGAAAAVATRALARDDAATIGLVGCGLHGTWAGRCLVAEGYTDGICADADEDAARKVADELGWRTGTTADALGCDVVTLVTPGHAPIITKRHLREGLHLNALGADGPGKAEVDPDAVAACRLFCDEWAQASHGGELTGAVAQGLIGRDDVTDLGGVLAGEEVGRSGPADITLFDSTGLAIQDLALVVELMRLHEAGHLKAGSVEL
jgi:ornithine cyclodeaminase/alanine dehydrogenase-like protein (mu-crystallin family)